MRDGGYRKVESLFELSEMFPTEDACRDYLFARRWPNGFQCPRCGFGKYYPIRTRNLYECANCSYQASLTAGTVMEKTRTPLRAWLFLIYMIASQKTGVSVLSASKMLGISYDRAWLMASKIGKAMERRDEMYKLTGFVELDESYFGAKKKPGKRGRGASGKRPVMVGVNFDEHGPKHAFMKVIERIDTGIIKEIARENIETASRVKTDGLNVYRAGLTGYHHEKIVIKDPKASSKELPWVHILVANAKNMIRGVHHGVSPSHLQSYLSEFSWRFSRRRFSCELFDRLLCCLIDGEPVTYRSIVPAAA